MKLMTKELEKKLPPLYSTSEIDSDKIMVHAKFFHAFSNYYWYVTEYDPVAKTFFGYQYGELGYFTLKQLEEINIRGLGVERDRGFKPCTLKSIIQANNFKY